MNPGKSIFTHVVVFAMGVTLAIVAHRSDSGSDEDRMASGNDSSVRASRAAGFGNESTSAPSRENRVPSSRSGKSAAPSSERLAEIVRMGDPLGRQAALMDLINHLGASEFLDVAEKYRQMDHYGDSQGEYEMILRGWAKVDPLAALEYTGRQKNGGRESLTVLAAWAANDGIAAERWAIEHSKGEGAANPWLAAVIGGIAAYDINHASELIASMPASRERADAMNAVTRALLVQGSNAAMAFPDTIKDPNLRIGFISEIATRIASKDPDKAATWLASMGDAESQTGASRRVGEALAREDPIAAEKWLPTLKPEARAEAARGIIPVMSSGDLTNISNTAQWVSTLAGIPNYDSVVEEFVWSCDYRDPEQSAAWIQGISDTAQQTRLYHRMLGGWAKRDPVAVKTWVAGNNVPASVAKRFK